MIPFVPSIVPNVLQALVLVLMFSFACAKPLRNHPAPFYLVFLAFSILMFFEKVLVGVPLLNMLGTWFASAYTGVAFYLVVMFAGAFDRKNPHVKTLLSIRSELSIIGGIIVAAHCVRVIYLPILAFTDSWDSIWGAAAPWMLAAMGVVGPLLTVCFLVPWITSFRAVRNCMTHKTWKKVQRLAYPFMILMVVQGFLLAVGHAVYLYPYAQMGIAGTTYAADFARYLVTAAVYVVFGLAYVILKVLQARKKNEKRAAEVSPSYAS